MAMIQSSASEVRAWDLISIPTYKELGVIERATQLFARVLKVVSYHEDKEERLNAMFMHQPEIQDDYGLYAQEAVSQFRHSVRGDGEQVFGPWSQVFNLSNAFLGVTVIHELAHLIDRYHLGPRYQWTSAGPTFIPLYEAYALTRSSFIIRQVSHGVFPTAVGPHGNRVEWPQDPAFRKMASERAQRNLLAHEVFARCTTAFVVYESINDCPPKQSEICDQFMRRMRSVRNQVSGYDLSEEDYQLIRQPLQEIFAGLGWTHGRP